MSNTRKHVYVLGTGLSHDGSSCLLKDGRIAVAIEKERVTRRKHDGHNDSDTVRYCLDAEGITVGDLSLVVQNENFGMFRGGNGWYGGPRVDFGDVPAVTISHHLAHAYSAFHASPFDEAATLVIDGCGSTLTDAMDPGDPIHPFEMPSDDLRHLYNEKDSYYLFGANGCRAVYKDFSQWGHGMQGLVGYPQTTLHSIGGVYLGVSTYVFAGFEDPGKLMGLAPYGKPGVFDFEMFDLREGRAFVRYDWMKSLDRPARTYDDFKASFQYYADLAHQAQREIERAILYVANARYELAPSDNLAYSGGVALNAVANRRLLKETKFKKLFIQPAAGDNGLALGCAYYGWIEVLKRERVRATGSSSFGRIYPDTRIKAALDGCGASVRYEPASDYIARAAKLLAEGKTVAWFQDGAEFGPRALGHRSILADPRVATMRDHINTNIKRREDFRPFAPSVRFEDASTYFDCDYESPYMITVAPVRPEWQERLPSVVHQDKSARIQTVSEADDPKYYALLTAFKEITGMSVVLNTSFNRRGMPIVETPEDALSFFAASPIDVLVIGHYVVTRQSVARTAGVPSMGSWVMPGRSRFVSR
jgi:carbamoyltransferase